MIVEVIVQSNVRNLNKVFDYRVPVELEETIKIGSRVLVPFGRMKKLEEAFVVGFKQASEYDVKQVAKIQENPILDEEKIELARWISKRYFCNIYDALKLMLPPGTTNNSAEKRVKEKSLNFVSLNKEIDEIEMDISAGKLKSERQIRTLRFVMENGDVLIPELEMFADTTKAVIQTLCKHEYLTVIEKQVQRNPFENKEIEKSTKLKLNEEQEIAYTTISNAMADDLYSEFLIYGVTGSR